MRKFRRLVGLVPPVGRTTSRELSGAIYRWKKSTPGPNGIYAELYRDGATLDFNRDVWYNLRYEKEGNKGEEK